MKTITVLIDGGFLRVQAKKSQKIYDPRFIQQFAGQCVVATDEEILRVLYYDCAPYQGSVKLPISGAAHQFTGSDQWLQDIAKLDLFAVRRGTLKFRGYKPIRSQAILGHALTDADFRPDFEQKGVDMRIGLDIASYAANRLVQRIVLVTNDTDCVPAMKLARKSGLQVVLAKLATCNPAAELVAHADFTRKIALP